MFRKAVTLDPRDATAWNGWGVSLSRLPGREHEAIAKYRKAAELGNAIAEENLGDAYENGVGLGPDIVEAVKWYRVAAEHGNASAQCRLGYAYRMGLGIAKDHAEAVKWYRKAAGAGHVTAQQHLGSFFNNGGGGKRDYVEALKWYRKAAEGGNATSQYFVGYYYFYGQGVTTNYPEAVRWFRKAAEQGYPDAMVGVGFCYGTGLGVRQSYADAMAWYRKAADRGDAAGQNGLAWILATCPDEQFLDGPEAVDYASEAVAQEPQRWDFVGTLAAACARAGRFSEAADEQEKAIKLINTHWARVWSEDRSTAAARAGRRLELYRRRAAFVAGPEDASEEDPALRVMATPP